VDEVRMRRSLIVRRAFLVAALVLLLGTGYTTWWAYSLPRDREQRVTLLNYQHRGEFDYKVYVTPNSLIGSSIPTPTPSKEPAPKCFTALIESITMSYSYRFVPEQPVAGVTEEVQISAVLEDPEYWRKEVVLVPESTYTGDFRITFPLHVEDLRQLIKNIRSELGNVGTSPSYVTLKVDVEVEADTAAGTLTDSFSQTARVTPFGAVVEWDEILNKSQRGSFEGLGYLHHGSFGYAVKLKPNSLYGPMILTPEAPEEAPDIVLAPGPTYFVKTIQRIEPTYSYRFTADKPLRHVSSEVEITASLSSGEDWSKTIVLVPNREETGNLVVSFSLDLDHLRQLGDTIRQETGVGSPPYSLPIQANVHTVAETEGSGTVDEEFKQMTTVPLTGATLTFGGDLRKTVPGSITDNVSVADPTARRARMWSPGALGGAALVLAFALWCYLRVKPVALRPIEAEALRAKRKYKDAIASVQCLPEVKEGETVISMSSLDDLMKTADELLKPVFHQAEPNRHIYCLIDSASRYVYVSQLAEPAPSPPPESQPVDET